MGNRQRAKTANKIHELRCKVEDFYNWACELPDWENMDGRASQAEAVIDVLDWILGDKESIELNSIDTGDLYGNRVWTWDEFYRILKKENNEQENEEEDE